MEMHDKTVPVHRPCFRFSPSFCIVTGEHARTAGKPREPLVPTIYAVIYLRLLHKYKIPVNQLQLIVRLRSMWVENLAHLNKAKVKWYSYGWSVIVIICKYDIVQ